MRHPPKPPPDDDQIHHHPQTEQTEQKTKARECLPGSTEYSGKQKNSAKLHNRWAIECRNCRIQSRWMSFDTGNQGCCHEHQASQGCCCSADEHIKILPLAQ